jgi:hypothetical protein
MLDIFQTFLGAKAGQSQSQTEALVDLLLLGIYSDNLISLAESDFIDQESEQLPWESGISFGGYLQRVIPKVRAVKGNPEKESEFLLDVAARLGDSEAKQRALDELTALLASDGLVQLEATFVEQVKTALQI